jgi:hypothetical protein
LGNTERERNLEMRPHLRRFGEDALLPNATGVDMIERIFKLQAKRACHGGRNHRFVAVEGLKCLSTTPNSDSDEINRSTFFKSSILRYDSVARRLFFQAGRQCLPFETRSNIELLRSLRSQPISTYTCTSSPGRVLISA